MHKTLNGLTPSQLRSMLTGGFSLSTLDRLMAEAVEAEAYEHAAVVRDMRAAYPEGLVVRTRANDALFALFETRPRRSLPALDDLDDEDDCIPA